MPDSAELERALLQLAPALVEETIEGLLLRSAQGLLPSANSAIPGLSDDLGEPQSQRRAAEQFYEDLRQPCQWLIGKRPANTALAAHLQATGYQPAQSRIIWSRDTSATSREDPAANHEATAGRISIELEHDPAHFAVLYGGLARQPEAAVRLQTLRLKILAQQHPMALLTARRQRSRNPGIEGCLLALVAAGPGSGPGGLEVEQTGRIGLLSDLFVTSEARRSGLASQLLAAAATWLSQAACEQVVLESAENNLAAEAFYRVLGFSKAAVWTFYRMPRNRKTGSAPTT